MGNDEKEENYLITSVQGVFRSSDHSDVTIISGSQEFKVHKVIISAQSGYFSRLFKHGWKEVQESVIRLQEDDSIAIEAMLHFMYGFQYDSPDLIQDRISPMLLHIKAYQAGDKYDVQKLKEEAQQKFMKNVESFWDDDEFPIAIAEIYSTTPQGDRGLRNCIVYVSLEHLDQLREKEVFKLVVEETVGFAADLVMNPIRSAGVVKCRCSKCTLEWPLQIGSCTERCGACGEIGYGRPC